MFKDRGVGFLGINVFWDNEVAAHRFVEARSVPYAVGHDTGNRIGSLYRVDRTPTTFFVAQDGNVAAVARGAMKPQGLTAALEQLLSKRKDQ